MTKKTNKKINNFNTDCGLYYKSKNIRTFCSSQPKLNWSWQAFGRAVLCNYSKFGTFSVSHQRNTSAPPCWFLRLAADHRYKTSTHILYLCRRQRKAGRRDQEQVSVTPWVMQFIQGHYESPREPDMERAEKSTDSLWEAPVCKKTSRYTQE